MCNCQMAATTGIFLNLGGGEKACECHGMVMCLEDYLAPSCHQLCCSKEEERILITLLHGFVSDLGETFTQKYGRKTYL